VTLDVVFDLDGTLVDSVPACRAIVNAMLEDRGADLRIGRAEMRQQISIGGARMIAALMGEHCGDPDAAIAEFRARYAEMDTPDASLFPGVREGLDRLSASGARLSICSSKPQNLCVQVLGDLGLADRFEIILGSSPGRPAKPDPALYHGLLHRIGGRTEVSCYIGDSQLDYALAREAGAPFILAAYGYGEAGFAPTDVPLARSFSQVPALIDRLFNAPPASQRAVA
jgi:phosphoglycolate phosphatase